MAGSGAAAGGPGPLTPQLLLRAYGAGIFPMAQGRRATRLLWLSPERRGVLPIRGFHISRSLGRRLRRGGYEVTLDRAFEAVIDACAERDETWINAEIRALSLALHRMGAAHSIEVWHAGALVGGSYGIALGGAFLGESMFSRATDGSKLALAHLTDHLDRQGFTLFDTQFLTEHLASLGGHEIARADYQRRLADAIALTVSFAPQAPLRSGAQIVAQRVRAAGAQAGP